MSKSARVIRTPGEEPTAQAAPEAQEHETTDTGQPTEAQDTTDPDPEPAASNPTDSADAALQAELAQLRAERDAQAAELRALQDEKAARDAEDRRKDAATQQQLSERLTSNKPMPGLHARDVDPSKIRRAVLTQEGWVAPVAAPKHPSER